MKSPNPVLIRNARILSMVDGSQEVPGDILVEDGRIAALGAVKAPADAEVLDAQGAIAMPGFVDCHRHVWQTQLRTLAGDWSLFDYLARMRLLYSAFYSPEDVYIGNYVGALEAINAGITTLVDHCHILNSPEHTIEAVRGLNDAGTRAVFCYGLFSNPKSHAPFVVETDQSWRHEDARRLRAGALASDEGRILFGLAPNEPEAASDELLVSDLHLARELDARVISCHVAMGAYDRGRQVVRKLYKAGLLDARLLFVHGASLTDGEFQLIADAGAGICSTPETELQMGMGDPIAFKARAAGARASLGIDIVSNYSGEMFTQMRMMLQSARARANATLWSRGLAPRAVPIPARDVLRLATLGGAESLHLESHIGTLELGKQADLILIRADTLSMSPATDAMAAVIFNAGAGDVDSVMVAGQWLKRGGVLTGVDWVQTRTRLQRSAERVLKAAGEIDESIPLGVAENFFGNLETPHRAG
jgi:cytosine/adenosine deaminase-related metal-dependent hydrolase